MANLQQHHARTWRRRFQLVLIIGVTAMALPGAPARSADNVTGTMDASGQGLPPKGAAIGVRAASGGPDSQAIADMFRDALEAAGFRPGGGAGYSLTFLISGEGSYGRRGSSLELRGSEGSSSSGEVELTMRWKATRDKTRGARESRRLTISITDGDRAEVWQARIELRASDADDLAMVNAVMPALIANIGRTVYALRVP